MSWLCGCKNEKHGNTKIHVERIKATSETLGVDLGTIAHLEFLVASENVNVKQITELIFELMYFANQTTDTGNFSVRFASVSVLMEVLLTGEFAVGVHYALISELGRKLQPEISRLLLDTAKKELVKMHVGRWMEKISDVHSDTPWQQIRTEIGNSPRRAGKSQTRIDPDWATLLVKSFSFFWHANQKDTFTVLLFSAVRVIFRQNALLAAVSDLMDHFARSTDATQATALWHHVCKAVFHTFGAEICAEIGNSMYAVVAEAPGVIGAALRRAPGDLPEEAASAVSKYLLSGVARSLNRVLVVFERDAGVHLLRLLVKRANDGVFKTHVYAALVAVSLEKHGKMKTHLWRRRMVEQVLTAHPAIDGITTATSSQPDDFRFLASLAAVASRGGALAAMDAETAISGCAKFRLPVDKLETSDAENFESRKLAQERLVLAELKNAKDELLSEISSGHRLLHEFRMIRELQVKHHALPDLGGDGTSDDDAAIVRQSPPRRRVSVLVSQVRVENSRDERLRRSVRAMQAAFPNERVI